MKLSSLLTQRQALLEKARLANLAFAYERLENFARRIACAKLSGKVRLQTAPLIVESYLPTLAAIECNQSVIDEHFNDDDLLDLADVLTYISDESQLDLVFRLQEIESRFLTPLRAELTKAGVTIDRVPPTSDRQNSVDCARNDEI